MSERVKAFVRKTLGCDCSEDVFAHIENERNVAVDGIVLRNRINVGNRLLVYVAGPEAVDKLPQLLLTGKAERDIRGFNRFRLVIVTDDVKLKKAATDAFEAIPGLDEKMYLHIVGKSTAFDL